MKFFIYLDRTKQYRWRLVARNNRVIAIAGEGFTTKRNCKKSILRLCDAAAATVADTTMQKGEWRFSTSNSKPLIIKAH